MGKTFSEQVSKYSIENAHMVYSKFVSEAYYIRSCEKDYNKGKVESNKLRIDFASYGVTCDKLATCIGGYKKKIQCEIVAKPCAVEEPTVECNTICHHEHIQSVASKVWIIEHPLNFNPNVTTVALINGVEIEIKGIVTYVEDKKKVKVEFSQAVAGKAYLS